MVHAIAFLNINGLALSGDEARAATAILALAAGEMTEAGFAAWLWENTREQSVQVGKG